MRSTEFGRLSPVIQHGSFRRGGWIKVLGFLWYERIYIWTPSEERVEIMISLGRSGPANLDHSGLQLKYTGPWRIHGNVT